jgi:hypothetical protein
MTLWVASALSVILCASKGYGQQSATSAVVLPRAEDILLATKVSRSVVAVREGFRFRTRREFRRVRHTPSEITSRGVQGSSS